MYSMFLPTVLTLVGRTFIPTRTVRLGPRDSEFAHFLPMRSACVYIYT